jgi:hypothetical protein
MEDAMSYRLLTVALITAGAVFATQFYAPAEAAKNLNTSRSNIYREGTPKGTTGPAATTVKGSKSNSSDRMGGGGGGKGAAGVTAVKGSKSNSSDRMGGGGGGKGAGQLNPQPEPPGRR